MTDPRGWTAVDPALLAAVRNAVNVSNASMLQAPATRTWPIDADGGHLACLRERIPKASKARVSTVIDATRHRVQEKLNGVFLLWDGAGLWTKSGFRVPAPKRLLSAMPPGVPLLGELFLGYGHDGMWTAVTLAKGNLPKQHSVAGDDPAAGKAAIWKHARFVAFDMPGLAELPYGERYRLLCLVIGSLYRKIGKSFQPIHLPVQVIRQYATSDLPGFFREVVHGWTAWKERRFLPFGVPRLSDHTHQHQSLGCLVHPFMDNWHSEGAAPLFAAVSDAVNGEGLMIWDQEAPWQPRGAAGVPTAAVLKYKPTILTTGLVTAEPYIHGHRVHVGDDGEAILTRKRRQRDGDPEDGECVGYSVEVRWWNPLRGRYVHVTPYAAPRMNARQVVEKFPLNTRVFFTFVLYDQQPLYLTAIGPTLKPDAAERVQSGFGTARSPPLGPGRRRGGRPARSACCTPPRGRKGKCGRCSPPTWTGSRCVSCGTTPRRRS